MAGGLAALGSLAGGFAQGLDQSYINALRAAQIKAQQQANAGQQDAGQILSALYGGPQGPIAPQQPQGGLSGLLSRIGLGGAGGPSQSPATPMPQGPRMAPGGAPMQGSPGPSGPQGGGPAPSAPSMGAGPLTLEQAVQAARQADPNMTGARLMSAVERLTPIMSAQALQQYRGIQQQLAQQRIVMTERGQDLSHEDRQAAEAGRDTRAQTSLDEKMREFNTRQTTRTEQFNQLLQEKYDAISATNDRAEKGRLAADARSAVQAQFAAERNEIYADNDLGPERTRLVQEASKRADEANKRLDEAAKAKPQESQPLPKGETPKTDMKSSQAATQGLQLLGEARDAIAKGAPRDKVIARLKEKGVDPAGL